MTHIIYIGLIIYAFVIGIYWDSTYTFKRNISTCFLLIFYPFLITYIFLQRILKSDYVFFIRVLLFKYKIKNVERLIFNINERMKKKGKLYILLANKVKKKVSQ